jgi:hypothetical protein
MQTQSPLFEGPRTFESIPQVSLNIIRAVLTRYIVVSPISLLLLTSFGLTQGTALGVRQYTIKSQGHVQG